MTTITKPVANWKHDFIQANGIGIHYVTAGKGPLVLLLHGFPESWYSWRQQIPALAEHFQVVAPDLRGYGETDRPSKVSDYQSKNLAEDVVGLIKVLGHEKAHIVGHDWGGAVAWKTAMDYPDVVDHLVVLNCPHPYLFSKALSSNFSQMKKSWYIFAFQLPYIPELLFKASPQKMLEKVLRGSTRKPEIFKDEDIQQYLRNLQKPGAIEAALNYYRAALRNKPEKDALKKKIKAPTMLIWGEEDQALGKDLTIGTEELIEGPFKLEYVPGCSHWINEEQPELVNQLIINFLEKQKF